MSLPTIERKPGRKGPEDTVLYVSGKKVTFAEVWSRWFHADTEEEKKFWLGIREELCANEDALYPPSKGFMGGRMLRDTWDMSTQQGQWVKWW